jgi:ubiquinone/menaquinone biosynthesis C-methylase UbiE
LARNAGANILGADFSSSAILKARQLAASLQLQLRWEIMDVQSIAHPDNSFDVVISCETIEHLPDPKRAIRELARILRPGGKLFLTTPNYLNLIGLYRGYMRMKGTPYTETGQPINRFVMLPQTLRWIRSAGLGVLTFDSRNLYLPLPGRPWTLAKWLEHPRFLVRWLGFHSLVVAVK